MKKKNIITGSLIATLVLALGFAFVYKKHFSQKPSRIVASEQLEMFPEQPKPYDRSTELRLDKTTTDGRPGSMMFVDVKDQGQYGMCFAEAAAQMVDAYRFTVLGETNHAVKTSVMALAITGQAIYANTPLFGGWPEQMIAHIHSMGIQSELSITKCALKNTKLNEVNALMKFHDEYNARLEKKIKELKDAGIVSIGSNLSYQELKTKLNSKFSNMVVEFLSKTGRAFSEIPPVTVVSQLLDAPGFYFYWGVVNFACVNTVPRIKVDLPKAITKDTTKISYNEFLKFIDKNITSERSLPIGIAYCYSVLIDGKNYQGFDRKRNDCLPDKYGRAGGGHASLVIGKRKNPKTGTPDLLVRNSWGKVCKSTRSKLTMPLEIRQKFQSKWFPKEDDVEGKPIYSTEWDCDAGNIWIDAKALYTSLFQVEYFSAK